MAITLNAVAGGEEVSGKVRGRYYDVTLDTSYPTGGYSIDPKSVGLLVIYGVEIVGSALVSGAAKTTDFLPVWDFKTSKLQLFQDLAVAAAAPFGEVAAATNVSTRVYRLVFRGI
jgi:hypothetical protein